MIGKCLISDLREYLIYYASGKAEIEWGVEKGSLYNTSDIDEFIISITSDFGEESIYIFDGEEENVYEEDNVINYVENIEDYRKIGKYTLNSYPYSDFLIISPTKCMCDGDTILAIMTKEE